MTGEKKPKRQGARAKLRSHFLNNIGRVMDVDELRGAAGGITEWAQVRRATGATQLVLLAWLVKKFPAQTRQFLDSEVGEIEA